MFDIDLAQIEQSLKAFTLYYEVLPYRGYIDHSKMEIAINPIFQTDAEILMHELLHHLHREAPEGFVIEGAKDVIKGRADIKDFLESYCRNHARRRGSSFFGLL